MPQMIALLHGCGALASVFVDWTAYRVHGATDLTNAGQACFISAGKLGLIDVESGGVGGSGSGGQVNLTGGAGSGPVSGYSTGGVPPLGIGFPQIVAASHVLTASIGYAYGAYAGAGGYSEGYVTVTGNVTVTVGAGGDGAGGNGLVIVYY